MNIRLITVVVAVTSLLACNHGHPGEESVDSPQPAATPSPSLDSGSAPATVAGARVELAKRLYEDLLYVEARDELDRALALDPDHVEAKRLAERLDFLMGRPPHRPVAIGCAPVEPTLERWRHAIEALLERAEAAIEAGDRPEAVRLGHQALEIIRWSPYRLDDGEYEVRARAFMES